MLIIDMLLELDDVTVWNSLCVGRGQEWSSVRVNSLSAERGDDSRGDAGREGESSEALHDDELRRGSCIVGVVVVVVLMTTGDKERRESASDRIEDESQKEDNKSTKEEGDERSMMVGMDV